MFLNILFVFPHLCLYTKTLSASLPSKFCVKSFMVRYNFSESCQWLQPQMKGSVPEARGNHCAAAVANKLIIFGGSADFCQETHACQKIFGDCYSLSIE